MKIRELFDPTKDINRRIEMVITYGADQKESLKSEINEYVVTENIEEQLRKLLDLMQTAMDSGEENEIGVWVSGFYGSGKSSLTKYVGFAMDENVSIDGVRFTKMLQDRLSTAQVKAQLNTVASRFPAAVVMLDLASEMLAGVSNADVSTVLYLKVLQWAGYSNNLSVARLEQMLERDGRFAEFESKFAEIAPGMTWRQVQNDPIVISSLVPGLASQLYPQLFPTNSSFSTKVDEYFQLEDKRVEEMIEIVRRKSGKEYVLFVIDEVGQYVASGDHLILNLDGLAKNLKRIGKGKVWLFSTAQQTLTEDDPRAAFNTAKLFKLKDRFPIQIDLESNDIKEICYRRLLKKSPDGQEALGRLFDAQGQQLRNSTALQDAAYYDSGFDKQSFVNLYPFLPAHFSVLLHLLAALAKSTGGIGLRSAIKVIQEILINSPAGGDAENAAVEKPLGWMANTVTLYDALEKDIRRAFQPIHVAVGNTSIQHVDSKLHQDVAKTIAILQIVGNLPVTVHNVAALMHSDVLATSRLDEVRAAIEGMLANPLVPLSDKDGNLGFLSEKLRDIEKERGETAVRQVDLRRIGNDALRDVFDPLPRATLHATLTVTAGLRNHTGNLEAALAGDTHTIQFVTMLVSPANYEPAKLEMINESRGRSGQNYIYLISRASEAVDALAIEVFRSQRISELHRNDPDQEVRDYCAGQLERSRKLQIDLKHKFRHILAEGSFIFRGEITPVSAVNVDLMEATRKKLSEIAAQVYDKYAQAPVRAATDLAERLLKIGNPAAITDALDPMGLIQNAGGAPALNAGHAAVVSILDYLNQNGQTEGKRILDNFGSAPYSWSPDTVRYILAAMLTVGELKLKVSGTEVTAPGPKAIDALKNNISFKQIGVALRNNRPDPETLSRASTRLTEILGEQVIPLEQDISKAAVKYFPQLQSKYAPLSEKLRALGAGGVANIQELNQEIAGILESDGSEAPQRMGSETSQLYDGLKWAAGLHTALYNGLDKTIKTINEYAERIAGFPRSGRTAELQDLLAEDLEQVAQRLKNDDFHQHAADLSTKLTEIKTAVADAAGKMLDEHKIYVRRQAEELQFLPDWNELTQEEKTNATASVNDLAISVENDLDGISRLLNQLAVIVAEVDQIKAGIRNQAAERRRLRAIDSEVNTAGEPKTIRRISFPAKVTTTAGLDVLIGQLNGIRPVVSDGGEVEIEISRDSSQA